MGDIVARDGSNTSNIKDRTNKGHGSVNKIVTTLNERSYGKHYFKAAMLMRGAVLVGGMLTNAESWINITKKDYENLEKPDVLLQRKVVSVSGNPSKCFVQLELGIVPIEFLIKQKRLNFLHYILNEDISSITHQVYVALKEDYRKGDFVYLTNCDRKDLEIDLSDAEIGDMSKNMWKKYIKETVKSAALKCLVNEINTKEKN